MKKLLLLPLMFSAAAAVLIFARFDTDGIVTRIEYTIQDQCILARFQIECISVL